MVYRLTVLASHPVQYQAPLFRRLNARPELELEVLFMWEGGTKKKYDPGFRREVEWDVPVLQGYEWDVLRNLAPNDGPESFFGFMNPGIIRRLRSNPPDGVLIQGWSSFTNWLAVALARWGSPDLLFRGETVGRVENRASGFRHQLLKRFIGSFDAVFPIGTASEEFYDLMEYPKDQRFLTPYSVDNTFFFEEAQRFEGTRDQTLASVGLDPELPTVLFVAKLIPRKRPEDLLEAIASMDGDVQGLFVGDGPLREELEAQARHLDYVRFVGFKNQTELPRWYAAGDIFVLPSAFETWGLVVNEAMCFGLPVIATNQVSAARDLVEDGKNGFVTAVGATSQLAKRITELSSNRERAQRMGEESERIIQGWDIEECTDAMVEAVTMLATE